MLRYWNHPSADDAGFRNWLIEGASEALRQSLAGAVLLEDLKPDEVNFVAAVWYVEWSAVADLPESEFAAQRRAWLERVRRVVPSCFCNPRDLTD